MDKKMKLIDALKARYPKLNNEPLMEDLESVMFDEDESDMGGMMEEEEGEMPMLEDEMGEESYSEEGEDEDYLTPPDEEDDGQAELMAILGKPKKPRRKM